MPPDYTPQQLLQAYSRAGFQGQDLLTMTAIGLTENPKRQLNAVSPTNDYGPSQVNLPTWGHLGEPFTPSTLFTLDGAARAAKIIFDQAGGTFNDWTTYTGGQYAANIPTAQQAMLSTVLPGGGNALFPNLPSVGIPSLPNLNPIDALTSGINGAVAVIKKPIDLIVSVLTWLAQTKHWWEIGFIMAGLGMIIAGLVVYFHNEAEDVAKTAAIASA